MTLKGLKFRGIYGYEGPVTKKLALQKNKFPVDTANMIRSAGIAVEIVSAGSAGTYEVTGTYPGITKIEPGSFAFGFDPESSRYGFKTVNDVHFKSSLSVLTQIIGYNLSDRVITGAGLKVMSSGFCPSLVRLHGEIIDCESVRFSEEHGTVLFKERSELRKKLK